MPARYKSGDDYKEYDVLRFHIRNKRWWAMCSQIDVDALRKEIRAEEFSRLRARRLTTAERDELKVKVSDVQKRLYKAAKRLESHRGFGL